MAYYDLLRSAENGTDSAEHFTILRHLITLLYGENRGLESLRRVVSSHSATERVDIPIPYESDEDVVSFEEANVVTRSKVLSAASWLLEDWPVRFLESCWEAGVEHPALNRNEISVPRFLQVAGAAYQPQPDAGQRKPPQTVRTLPKKGTATG